MPFAWHKIRDHLMYSVSTLSFQRNFEVLRHIHDPLQQFQDPFALLDMLHRVSGDPNSKNLILLTLVQAAQSDETMADCALTTLLLALWPGLDAIRRRSMRRQIGHHDEISSDLLARSVEAIRCLKLNRVNRIAATVLRSVERDMIRARQHEAKQQSVAQNIALDEIIATQGDLDMALHYACLADEARRTLADDALLIIRVAVEGFLQPEVAAQLGVSEEAGRKRYQRAIRKLRDRLSKKF